MANFLTSNKRKRGRAADKLSVRLFLLDPEKETTKVTKEIGSEKGRNELIEKGCGPPRPEHSVAGETVEFSFDLTNVEFIQKIVEIYPILENGFFVFMIAGKDNILKELNPGRCCYRCYTPENVYHSERGQGRLYIRKIAENQIFPCNHGISMRKRFGLIPILPKPSIATTTSVTSEPQKNDISLPGMPTNHQLPILGHAQTESRALLFPPSSIAPIDLSSSSISISEGESSQAHSTVFTSRQLIPSTIGEIGLTPPPHNSVNITTRNLLTPLITTPVVSDMGSTPPVYNSVNVLPQSQLPSVINGSVSTPPVFSTNAMTTPNPSLLSGVLGTPPTSSMISPVTMATFTPSTSVSNTNTIRLGRSATPGGVGRLPTPSMVPPDTWASLLSLPSGAVFSSGTMTAPGLSLRSSGPWILPSTSITQSVTMPTQSLFPRSVSRPVFTSAPDFSSVGRTTQDSNIVPGNNLDMGSGVFPADVNDGESSNARENEVSGIDMLQAALLLLESSGQNVLPNATVDRGLLQETEMSDMRSWTNPHLQENLDLVQRQWNIDAVLENIRSTGKLEISLTFLNDDHLLKKLNESAINIHTVEIQSTCKLQEVLKKYSLSPCLKYLRITDNNLDFEDIFALLRSSGSVKNLHELDLSRTKFKENSFSCLMTVLFNCSDIEHLFLTDNSLTEKERNCLVIVFNSIKNLKNLKLSKNNLTEAQVNDILQKHGEGKTIVSLDLSQNAIQGDKIISNICKLKSLEKLNLSHNHIRFPSLGSSDEESDNFLTNTKIISLSSNHMTSDDIYLLPSWIRSDLINLNLDLNHVGCSILTLRSLRIGHLKVLSLANTDVSGPATQNLAIVLSSARQLEELNLSSNNLMLEDFQQLVSPLSSLTELKKLNLNNNPGGISVVLEKILPCMKRLEELRLSNTRLNGDDCNKFFESLKFLKELRYLDLSNNVISPSGVRALSDILKEFPLLEGLDMSECCIQEYGICQLCVGLIPLNKLKNLNLRGNRIYSDKFVIDSLFLTSTLEEVILSDIIHGEKLFKSMILLTDTLRKLHVSKMKLRQHDVEALANMLSSFLYLEELVLIDIIADLKCETIFGAIGKMKKLKKLVLRGITVDNKKAFFDMLSCLSVLEKIVFPEFWIDRSDTECVNVLQSLVYLKNLDLSQTTSIDGLGLAEILASFILLEKLTLGRIGCHSYECNRQLCNAIRKLNYLKELNLSCLPDGLAEILPLLQFLEKLKIVYVDRNDKQLSHAVRELKYLKKLKLHYVWNTTTDLIPLAEALLSLQFLEELELTGINLDDGGSETQLFRAVGKLKYLKKLRITSITQLGVVALMEILPSLQLLESLVLDAEYGASCEGESDTELFHAVRKLKYLKELDLSAIRISPQGVVALTDILPSLPLLEKLVLGECDLDRGNDEQLFYALVKLKYLKDLNLLHTKITPLGVEALIKILPSLQLLENLVFGEINFDSDSEVRLFYAVGKLLYLENLGVAEINVTRPGAEALAQVLPSLQLLESLWLGEIEFSQGMNQDKQLFGAVGKLKYLKKLDLSHSKITETGASALADVFPSLHWLEEIILEYIEFDEGSEKQVFHALGKLRYLQKLKIYNIKITQSGAKALVEAFSSLQLLEELALGEIDFDNEIDTQLFHAIEKLKYLKFLSLRHTKITQASAKILTKVLPTLRNLRELMLPIIQSSENETDDENETPLSKLRTAAGHIPGLEIFDLN